MEEKTSYKLAYNEWFTVKMDADRELDPVEYDKAAFEAVLSDIVFRTGINGVNDREEFWNWMLTQAGLALKASGFNASKEEDPLDTVISVATLLKKNRTVRE